jgi:hypothetical protein
MAKDNRTFEQGYADGYRSVHPGAPIAIPPHAVPAGKTPYEWGYEVGVRAAKGGSR